MNEEILISFYTEYLAWVGSNAPESVRFDRKWGLCSNLRQYLDASTISPTAAAEVRTLQEELLDADFSTNTPFNTNIFAYQAEADSKVCHLNEARAAWVRRKLVQLKQLKGETKMKHPKHAELLAIANGEQMQTKCNSIWSDISPSEALHILHQGGNLRIKPRTFTINGKELAAPVTVAPKVGERYYYVPLSVESNYAYAWNDDTTDRKLLAAGRIFASREDVQAVLDAFRATLEEGVK